MEESLEKLFKELLQKKLHGTITADEEVIMADLAAQKRGGGSLGNRPVAPIPSPGLVNLGNLMGEIDSLNSSLDEMAGKIGQRSGSAEGKKALADAEKKAREKKS